MSGRLDSRVGALEKKVTGPSIGRVLRVHCYGPMTTPADRVDTAINDALRDAGMERLADDFILARHIIDDCKLRAEFVRR